MSYLDDVEFVTNPDPRCPCILLLDTSGSMNGSPIIALNQGLQAFQSDLLQDELAQRRVEIAIVTFGNGGVRPIQDFVTADQFQTPFLLADGDTPMGRAIELAITMLRNRKDQYKANGIAYYRPWIFMITDGAPTDQWELAAQSLRTEESAGSLAFFAVGVEGANMQILSQIAVRPPMMLQGLQFVNLFLWLSRSQKRVSSGKVGQQTALPPIEGWAKV
ncbi:MAG TPA: VWA domain-containing protein [Ktedonobacteraceae bacterium]